MSITWQEHKRLLAKRDEIAVMIKAALPRVGVRDYEEALRVMYAQLGAALDITAERVEQLEAYALGHVDYLSKFSLRLAEECFGLPQDNS